MFSDDTNALRATDTSAKNSPLIRERSENPQKVRDVSRSARAAIFGRPKRVQMDQSGEQGNGILTDFRSDRRIEVQFEGVGAHPWLPAQRHGLARGIYSRLAADGRGSSKQIPSQVQWRLGPLPSASGNSASRLVSGANPFVFLGGRMMMRICSFFRIPRSRGSLPNERSCARWRRKPPLRKSPKASYAVCRRNRNHLIANVCESEIPFYFLRPRTAGARRSLVARRRSLPSTTPR